MCPDLFSNQLFTWFWSQWRQRCWTSFNEDMSKAIGDTYFWNISQILNVALQATIDTSLKWLSQNKVDQSQSKTSLLSCIEVIKVWSNWMTGSLKPKSTEFTETLRRSATVTLVTCFRTTWCWRRRWSKVRTIFISYSFQLFNKFLPISTISRPKSRPV